MREIKLSYIFKNDDTGSLFENIFILEDIVSGCLLDELFSQFTFISRRQCIGLEDKSGREIYEGDIVTCSVSVSGGFLPHMGAIVWHEWYGAFATENDAGLTLLHNHALSSFEVIGNIYENPDLLDTQ
jgi:uncharacterized phage protein (TIGR01671 family)